MFEIVNSFLIFGLISLSLGFDELISIRDIATCRHEHKHIAQNINIDFKNVVPLTSFIYGIRPYEKKLSFYFKGLHGFRIMFSKKPEVPSDEKVVHISKSAFAIYN